MDNILEFKHYLLAGVITYTLTSLTDCIVNFSFISEMIIYCVVYTAISFIICKIKTTDIIESRKQ